MGRFSRHEFDLLPKRDLKTILCGDVAARMEFLCLTGPYCFLNCTRNCYF